MSDDVQQRPVPLDQMHLGSERGPLPLKHRYEIRKLYELLGHYLEPTLEAFERDFRRDLHPEREIAVWWKIAVAWMLFHDRHTQGQLLAAAVEQQLVNCFAALSIGAALPGDTEGWTEAVTECWRDASERGD